MIRAALVMFRLACLAVLYWFLYRVCACLISDAQASSVACREGDEKAEEDSDG
ncbi:MAG TPA: hypothetical protein PLM74_05075 [Bacillota bacterium]|nr:hypothetical protein [Bacillota bacterium]